MLQRTLSSYYRQENCKQFPLWIWLCLAKSWSISTWLNMSSWIYSRSNGTALSEEHSTPSSLSSSCSSYSPPAALSCGRQLPRSLKTASRLTGMTTPPAWCPISQPTRSSFANNGYIDFIPWVSREQGKISFVVCVLATETAPVAAMSLTVRPIHNS